MKTFFTSDTHFGHENIIKYCNRPFSSVDEMDQTLIYNWNNVVGTEDRIYHLGDFTLLGYRKFAEYLTKLNGEIIIIPGGHDWRWIEEIDESKITSKSGYFYLLESTLVSLTYSQLSQTKYPQVIVLCHYAMRVWDRSHYGAWHLYGHSHGTLPGIGKSFDVGVDNWNYTPVSLDQITEKMNTIV